MCSRARLDRIQEATAVFFAKDDADLPDEVAHTHAVHTRDPLPLPSSLVCLGPNSDIIGACVIIVRSRQRDDTGYFPATCEKSK